MTSTFLELIGLMDYQIQINTRLMHIMGKNIGSTIRPDVHIASNIVLTVLKFILGYVMFG